MTMKSKVKAIERTFDYIDICLMKYDMVIRDLDQDQKKYFKENLLRPLKKMVKGNASVLHILYQTLANNCKGEQKETQAYIDQIIAGKKAAHDAG